MIVDAVTNKPLRVLTVGTAGPYINLPFSQVDEVRRLLDASGIYHWMSENVISFNGGPEMAVINLGREGNAAAVQAVLDAGH